MLNNKYFILFFFLSALIFAEVNSSPLGKGLSCNLKSDSESRKHQYFRGLYFESNESVRVVSFKNKNKSLKVISKLTPYKISNDFIKFKVKFIWYGHISFEDFKLSRETLELYNETNNEMNILQCEILEDEFMYEMNKLKSEFQFNFNNESKLNRI